MGMFDYVTCQLPLPDINEVTDEIFQSKNLDRLMNEYQIREDGTLWIKKYQFDPIDHVKYNTDFKKLTDAHFDIIFYGGSRFYVDGKYRYYTARFTNGYLESLTYQDKG